MAQKKAKTNKKTSKKKAAKRGAKRKEVSLNENQTKLVKNLSGARKFTSSSAHRMTQQSLIDKGLAKTDRTGTKIKLTGSGKRTAKKI